MDKLNFTKKVLKLLIKVYKYFDDAQARDDCKKMLSETIKKENLEKQKLSHQASLNILEIPRITPTAKTDKSVVSAKKLFDYLCALTKVHLDVLYNNSNYTYTIWGRASV